MLEAFQNLVRSLIGPITPRIDGLDCDCGGSDCGGSDCGGSDCSDCNGSDCDSGDSCKAADVSSSAESSSDVTDVSDSSGSSSDRRTRDAGLVGGAVVGAAAAHHHRKKKEQRNANDATDQDLAAIPVASETNAASAASVTAAQSLTVSARSVSAYVSSSGVQKLIFIVSLLGATLFHRSVTTMVRIFERLFGKVKVEGEELIPESGSFTLAVNHFHGAWTPFVTAAVLAAVKRQRPDVVDDIALVIGQRNDGKKRVFIARWIRSIVLWILHRWQHNIPRIPLGNKTVAIDSLRNLETGGKGASHLCLSGRFGERDIRACSSGSRSVCPLSRCAVHSLCRLVAPGRVACRIRCTDSLGGEYGAKRFAGGVVDCSTSPADLVPSWRDALERWNRAHNKVSA